MKFENDLMLTRQNVVYNLSKKNTFKLMCNAMLGKFSQRSQFSETIFVQSQADIEALYQKSNIIDVLGISDNICEIQILPDEVKKMPNRSGNCIIGAFVTSYARIHFHKDMQKLLNFGFNLCYVDTDGIICTGPKHAKFPLSVSPCLGDYKYELGFKTEIKSFACIAKKSYSLSFLNPNTQEKGCTVKSSGLSLVSSHSLKKATHEKFKNMVLNWNRQQPDTIEIQQMRKFIIKNQRSVKSQISTFKLSNSLDVHRIVSNIHEMTVPYGFCSQ